IYLSKSRKKPDPVWAPWHAFAALPEKEFAEKAAEVAKEFANAQAANPLVAKTFADQPPKSLADVARRYAELVNGVHKLSEEKGDLDASQKGLLQVFVSPDAPPNVRMSLYGELDLLPDRASQARLQELRKAVEQWRANGPGAPPRAMVLEDLPVPYGPRVFVRGNPNQLGDAVPRQFLGALGGPRRQPFRDGSGRLELARAILDPANPLAARGL